MNGISASLLKPLPSIAYNLDDTVNTEKLGEPDTSYSRATSYTYTNRDWIDAIAMKRKTTTKLALAYTYDDVGNVKTIGSETYTYDWLDRLRSASGGSLPSGLTYSYDAVGNALTFAGKSCTYGAYNKLTSDGTWSYAYDGNGNLARKTSSDGKTAYQYLFNSLDQLTSAVKWTKSGQTWSSTTLGIYRYDANGMRANTTEGTTRTDYVYVGHDPWYERSKTGTTQTTTDYIYVNGRLEAKIVGGGSSPGTYFYISDALGSVRQVWKQGGTSSSFSVSTYKPFGTPVGISGTADKVGYAGELIDSAAGTSPGLYYIGARWMDPELGRFVSMDPELGRLNAPQTQNRYVYCVNNPLKFVDPTGGRSYSVNDNFWSIMPGWLAPLEVLEEMLTRIFTRDVFIAIGGLRAMQRIAAKTYGVVLDRAARIFIKSCAIGHELANSVIPRAIETGKQVVKTISHRIIEEATSILERTILVASRLERIIDETIVEPTLTITRWMIRVTILKPTSTIANDIVETWQGMKEAATPQLYAVGYELGTGRPELGLQNTGGFWGSFAGGSIHTHTYR